MHRLPAVHGHDLDHYIEAQVHGPVTLATDVEALVMDPSFRGTESGNLLGEMARVAGWSIEWHDGYRLAASDFPPAFRGPQIPPLAAFVQQTFATASYVDAATVGRAAAPAVREPATWAAWGTPEEVLQHVKYLWHTVVRYGRAEQDW